MNKKQEELSLEDIKNKFTQSEFKMHELKNSLADHQQQAEDLCYLIEKERKQLKEIELEHQIVSDLYHQKQKEFFKDHLGGQGFQKILDQAAPLFTKIKNKTTEFIALFDQNGESKLWFNEQYDKYVKLSVEKGKGIKSKEEVIKILNSFKHIKAEASELNLYEMLNKLEGEVDSIRNAAGKILEKVSPKEKLNTLFKPIELKNHQNLSVDKYLELKKEIMNPAVIGKKEVLLQWMFISYIDKNLTIDDEDIFLSYKQYVTFAKKKYGKDHINLVYSQKGGAFKTAIKKYSSIFM